jgi:hypothetical protein
MQVGEPWKAQNRDAMFNRFEIAGQLIACSIRCVGSITPSFQPLSAALLFYTQHEEE